MIVFDLDGTLVDSIRDIAAAVQDALARMAPGARRLEQHEIHAFVGDGARVLVARCLAAAGISGRAEDALPLYLEAYHRRMLDTTAFYPGTLEALETLKDRTLCVLTNKPGGLSRALLAGLRADHLFARIWGGGDVENPKPDPTGLLRLMGEMGARPEETVMVGDSPVDIATGRAAAAFTVGVTFGFDPRGVVDARPDAMIADLRELPKLLSARESGGFHPRP